MGLHEDIAILKAAALTPKEGPVSSETESNRIHDQIDSGRHAGIDFATTYYYELKDGAYHIRSVVLGDRFKRVGITFINELGFMQDDDVRRYGSGLARAVIGYVWKAPYLDDHLL